MSVLYTELLLYATTNLPSADSGTLGGAIDTGNQISDEQTGKIFVSPIYANADGGAEKYYYGKVHFKNINGSSFDLVDGIVWVDNILQDPTTTGTLGITTGAVADNDDKYVRIYGENNAGTPTYEDVTLSSTPGTVYSSTQWLLNRRLAIELRNVDDDTLSEAAGDITFTRATQTLGKIPGPIGTSSGRSVATGRIDIGVESNLDDSTTTTNRVTAPGGITFYRANEANALDIANSGVLTAGSYQSVWVKLTFHDGALPIEDNFIDFAIDGLTE